MAEEPWEVKTLPIATSISSPELRSSWSIGSTNREEGEPLGIDGAQPKHQLCRNKVDVSMSVVCKKSYPRYIDESMSVVRSVEKKFTPGHMERRIKDHEAGDHYHRGPLVVHVVEGDWLKCKICLKFW